MYKVCIYNNAVETLIHYPSPQKNAPKLLELPLKESLSQPEQLSFAVPYGNPGYDLIQGITTKVKVFDIRDNSTVFSGRVIPIKDGVTSEGKFTKVVTCEGAMAYLVDTQTRRWHFENQTPTQILQYLLNQHNSRVDNSRKINLGTIQLTQKITIDTNYESTLNAIITKVKNILGGDIRVQERSGVLYLDYLTDQGANNGVEIKLGYNLKELVREYDPTDIVTRVIPLGYGEGINQLDITSINNGVEYIEDADAIAKYGVIEGVSTNKDIQDRDTLVLWGQTVLNEKKQPMFSYQQTAYDLSVLVGHEGEKYSLGDTLHTIIDVLSIDVYSRVVERDRDLINSPWNPNLTISTRPITLTDQIIDLKQRSMTLENAPQGSTYIDTYGYADNIDATHSLQIPVWISPDILNVNRVRLHIDGQKYRAYEKSITGKSSTKTTTLGSDNETSDASSETTTKDDGATTARVKEWGNPADNISIKAPITEYPDPEGLPDGPFINNPYYDYDYNSTTGNVTYAAAKSWCYPDAQFGYYAETDLYLLQHSHDIPAHSHHMEHTHKMPHTHGMDHTHPDTLDYGILESTYPKNVNVKIDGVKVAGPYATTGAAFSVDLDLSQYINQPGATYNLEITSDQNGRVNAWISIQAFIQAK